MRSESLDKYLCTRWYHAFLCTGVTLPTRLGVRPLRIRRRVRKGMCLTSSKGGHTWLPLVW
jgi:hypothetical protein